MNTNAVMWRRWMAGAVLAHLVVTVVHGTAHSGAQVAMSAPANVFVFGVIVAGPIIGLALSWRFDRLGSWIVAVTMGASLVFGLANHFLLEGADHVSRVEPSWRTLFTTTAVLVGVTELLAMVFAVQVVRRGRAV